VVTSSSTTTVDSTLALALAAFSVYFVSLILNPWVKCAKCGGKPKSQGWAFSYAHHLCSKCRGTGQQVRFGRRLLGMGAGKPPP
jgi:DnaJ-class molecular chaperone